jgi:hypothetical protein
MAMPDQQPTWMELLEVHREMFQPFTALGKAMKESDQLTDEELERAASISRPCLVKSMATELLELRQEKVRHEQCKDEFDRMVVKNERLRHLDSIECDELRKENKRLRKQIEHIYGRDMP